MNKVMLMGRLTRDPELRMSPSGVAVTNFSIAVDKRFQKPGEERQADFFNVVCFRNTAEFVKKYFVKGQLLCLAGSLQTRTWESEGKKNYVTEVVADEVYFTGDKRENSGQQQQYHKPAAANDGYFPDPPSQDDGFMTVEDDQLPF